VEWRLSSVRSGTQPPKRQPMAYGLGSLLKNSASALRRPKSNSKSSFSATRTASYPVTFRLPDGQLVTVVTWTVVTCTNVFVLGEIVWLESQYFT
jgi:hypothetical protein